MITLIPYQEGLSLCSHFPWFTASYESMVLCARSVPFYFLAFPYQENQKSYDYLQCREPGSVPSFKWSIISYYYSYYSALLLEAPGCYASDSRTQQTHSLSPEFWYLKIFWVISIYHIYISYDYIFFSFLLLFRRDGKPNYEVLELYCLRVLFWFFLMCNSVNHGHYLL